MLLLVALLLATARAQVQAPVGAVLQVTTADGARAALPPRAAAFYSLFCNATRLSARVVVPAVAYRNGCGAIPRPAGAAAWVPLLVRGGCTFEQKVANAVVAGAAGALVADTTQG